MTLYEYISRFFTDSDVIHNIANGDSNTTVTTENGPVPSLAKLVADSQAAINAQAPSLASLGNSTSALEGAALVAFQSSLPYSAGSLGGYLNDIRGALRADDKRTAKLRVILGVIRNTGTGWQFIDDTGHSPTGFNAAAIAVVNGVIQIPHLFNGVKVGSVMAVVDETFAAKGYTVGGSIGTGQSNFTIGAPMRFIVDTNSNTVTAPPIFAGLITASYASGITTVNHPAADAGMSPQINKMRRAGDPIGSYPTCGYTDTTTLIEHNTVLGGMATYSAGVWSTVSDVDPINTPIGLSWDSVNGKLDVTHPRCTNSYDLQISQRGNFHPKISAVGSSIDRGKFSVEFYDNTGTKVTVQSLDMNFTWSRPGFVKSNINSGGLYSVDRGYVAVDASKVVSLTGNIWLFGVIEA